MPNDAVEEPESFLFLGALVVKRVGLGLVALLSSIAFVAFAVAGVGQVGVDIRFGQLLEPGFAVIAGIGGEDGVGVALVGGGVYQGDEQFLFRAGAVGLGGDDDLCLSKSTGNSFKPLWTGL